MYVFPLAFMFYSISWVLMNCRFLKLIEDILGRFGSQVLVFQFYECEKSIILFSITIRIKLMAI